MTTNARTKRRAASAGHGLGCVLLLILLSTVPARADDTAIGEPIAAAPPPPTIIYLEPPVAVFVGSLYAIEGVRPLFAAPLLCSASPCAVEAGMVISTDGEHGVVVEARPYTLALPAISR